MSVTIYRYRIYCNTTSDYQYVWSDTEPTVCPENNSHSIDSSSITIVDEVSTNQVKIKEENIPTGGNYQASTVTLLGMTGPTGTVYTVDQSWPIPVNAMNISVRSEEQHRGDMVDLVVGPNTITGILTQTAATGATGLYVSQTVVDNTMKGFYLKLFDGAKIFDCGRVLSIDTSSNLIVPENLPTSTFLVSSPTYIQQSVYYIKDFRCCTPQKFDIGVAKIGGSYVPPNIVVRAYYTLNSTLANNAPKHITAMIEYLY